MCIRDSASWGTTFLDSHEREKRYMSCASSSSSRNVVVLKTKAGMRAETKTPFLNDALCARGRRDGGRTLRRGRGRLMTTRTFAANDGGESGGKKNNNNNSHHRNGRGSETWRNKNEAKDEFSAKNKNCVVEARQLKNCLLYTSPSPRDQRGSSMPSSA